MNNIGQTFEESEELNIINRAALPTLTFSASATNVTKITPTATVTYKPPTG